MNPSAASELVGLFEYQLSMCKLERDELCLVITDTAFNPVYSDACIGASLNLGASAYKQILPFDHPLPIKAMGAAWQEADGTSAGKGRTNADDRSAAGGPEPTAG